MSARRDLRVDAVRGVALVSMYVAHCAPTLGPGRVLELTEYATYPLFALLVGVGATLGARESGDRWWVGPLVRGLVLVVLAELLDGLYAQVHVVLAYLGVLTWLAAPLARIPSAAVAATGLGAFAAAPWLGHSGPYQLASMVFFAAVGVLLARHLLTGGVETRLHSAIGAGCALVATAWFVLAGSDALDLRPYAVTHQVLVFDAVLVAAVTLLVAAAADRGPRLARPLAAMGAMSLTLYCLQILWLDADYRLLGHLSDDTWRNVAILVVGSLALALVWPGRRGPLEMPVAALVAQLTRRSVRV